MSKPGTIIPLTTEQVIQALQPYKDATVTLQSYHPTTLHQSNDSTAKAITVWQSVGGKRYITIWCDMPPKSYLDGINEVILVACAELPE